MLGFWDGNPIKLDYDDDHCTTINVKNSLSNKKRKKGNMCLSSSDFEINTQIIFSSCC